MSKPTENDAVAMSKRLTDIGFDYEAQPKEIVPCNLCGSIEWAVLASHDRFGHSATFVRCNRCGLIFLNPRMTADGYRDFYESGIYRKFAQVIGGKPMSDEGIVQYPTMLAEKFDDCFAARAGGTMLDIGGDDGRVTRFFADRYRYDATIVDPSANTGLAEDWATDGPYDVVTLIRTVDHLLDPMGVLQRAWGSVADDGMMFVDFVDWEYHSAETPLANTFKIDHPYCFTPPTFKQLLQQLTPSIRGVQCWRYGRSMLMVIEKPNDNLV